MLKEEVLKDVKNKVPVVAVIAVSLLSAAWNPLPAWAEDSLEYRYTERLLLVLSHCQAAESFLKRGMKVKGGATLLKGLRAADGQLESAQELLESVPWEEKGAFGQQIKAVQVAIRYLRVASQGFVEMSTGEQKYVDTPEYRAYLHRLTKALGEGWRLLRVATTYQKLLLVEPALGNDLAGPPLFRISRQERKELIRRIDELFGREIKAFKKGRRRGPRPDPAFENVTLAVLYLRGILKAKTYQELNQVRGKLFGSSL